MKGLIKIIAGLVLVLIGLLSFALLFTSMWRGQ